MKNKRILILLSIIGTINLSGCGDVDILFRLLFDFDDFEFELMFMGLLLLLSE